MDDSTTSSKRCKKCGEAKPLTAEFWSKNKKSKDGYQSHCKTCHTAYYRASREQNLATNRRWHERNIEKVQQYQREYREQNRSRCRKNARNWYWRHRDRVIQYREEHRERINRRARELYRIHNKYRREQHRKRREIHREHLRQYARIWRKRNHLRARESGRASEQRYRARKNNLPDTFTSAEWDRCLNYFQHRCAVCGRPQGLWHKIVPDHWIALADPRPDNPGTTADNIVPLCHGIDGCNNGKNNAPADEWLMRHLGKDRAIKILERINAYFEWVRKQ